MMEDLKEGLKKMWMKMKGEEIPSTGFDLKDYKEKLEEEKNRFGRYYTEEQVEKWVNKLKEKRPKQSEEDIKDVREFIRTKRVCSHAESMLHDLLQFEIVGPDSPDFEPPVECSRNFFMLHECLKRPGRPPGTNPDIIE